MGRRSTLSSGRIWNATPAPGTQWRPSPASHASRGEVRRRAVHVGAPGRATSFMTEPIFVDTSVWVYAVATAAPPQPQAVLQATAPATGRDLVVSTQVLTAV